MRTVNRKVKINYSIKNKGLSDSEKSFLDLLNDVSDFAIFIDRDGIIRWANDAAVRIFSVKKSGLTGMDIFGLLNGDLNNIFRKNFEKAAKTWKLIRFEHLKKNKWFEFSLRPVPDASGSIEKIALFGRDITSLKNMQKALNTQEQDLKKRSKELRCIYSISEISNKTDITLNKMLRKIVSAIPPAMQYPDNACARISMDADNYFSPGYTASEWRIEENIINNGAARGSISICYRENPAQGNNDPFLDEERAMLKAICRLSADIINRKQTETEIDERNELFRQLYYAAGVSITYFSPEGIMLSYNKAAANYSNSGLDDLEGKSLYDIFPRKEAEEHLRQIKDILNSDKPLEHTGKMKFPAGERWFKSTITRFLNHDVKPAGIQVISTDITERINAEETLRKSEERYRELFESINDTILVAYIENGMPGNFIEVNRLTCERLGYTHEELLKLSQRDIETPDSNKKAREHVRKLLEDGHVIFEAEHVAKDGTIIPVEINAHLFTLNDRQTVMSISRDITGRVRGMADLTETMETLKTVFDNSPIALEIYDKNAVLIKANQKVSEMFGTDAEKLYGTVSLKTDPKYQYPDVWEKLNRGNTVTHEIEFDNGQTPYKTSKRGKSHYTVITTPIPDQASKRVGYIVQILDITERKLAEKSADESEKRFSIMFQSMPIGISISDIPGGTLLDVNPAWLKTTGFKSREKVIGKTIGELGIISNIEQTQPVLSEFQRYGRVKNAEMVIHPIGDEKHVIKMNMETIHINNLNFKLNTIDDITERVKIAAALLESENRLKLFIEYAPAALAMFDRDMRYLACSRRWLNDFSLGDRDMFGLSHYDIFPEIGEAWKEVHRKGMAGEITSCEEDRFERADGSVQWLRWDVRPWRANDGSVGGIMIFSEDITKRKLTEEALRISEEKYRSVADYTYDWETWIDPENKFAYISPSCERITGYSINEFQENSRLMIDITHPDDKEIVREHFSAHQQEIKACQLDFRIITKKGEERWINHYCQPIYDRNGKFVGRRGSSRDITSRKQAENALHEANERMKAIIYSSPLAIVSIDLESNVTQWNPAAESVFGWTEQEVLGKPMPYLPEERQESHILFRERIVRDESFTVETYEKHRNDSRIDVNLSLAPLKNSAGKIIGIISVIADITERKRMEAALHESRLKLTTAIESMTDAVFISDAEGRFIEFNEAFATFHKFKNKDECAKTIAEYPGFLDVFTDTGEPAQFEQWAVPRALRGETATNAVYSLRRKDTGEEWVGSYSFAPIRNKKGTIVGSIVVGRDITEQKQLEKEREHLQSQLYQSQKMEALGTFVGGIAHDFNNMINVILGYSSLLQMELDQESEFYTYVDQVLKTAGKASNLIRGLLAFSRKDPVVKKPINLNSTIKDIAKLLKRLITEDITLDLDICDEEAIILGDPVQIEQLFFNLATNSRDAMPKGGQIDITTSLIEFDKEFTNILGYGKPGKYALITFSDNGTGMSKHTQEHMFDPFFTTKEVGKGTGLGMSTAYSIIKQHNGYISVYSEEGSGTTFNIYFPVTSETVEENDDDQSILKHGNETILVAEDNDSLRNLTKLILNKYDYTVIDAVDGEDAINKFNNFSNIDLLILDSVMPKKNGREVYDELLKIKPGIKVLFFSGYTKDVVLNKGIEEKEFDYISKPITPNLLLKKVREILDSK